MNIAEAAIRYKTITLVMTIMIIGGGALAYEQLGRLEDPEFTIKEAQVFTQYPGATAMEVAEEVTDEIETAVQQLGQVKLVTSISEAGLSTILVEVKDKYDKHTEKVMPLAKKEGWTVIDTKYDWKTVFPR